MIYRLMLTAMLLATAVMIRKIYDHLELKENQELFILVIGLFFDITGSLAMSHALSVPEIMLGHRILLIGRDLFGIGFILYYARYLKSKLGKPLVAFWNTVQISCLFCTVFYKENNWYLTNISIDKYNITSILRGDRHILYYIQVFAVVLIGLWALTLICREYLKIKSQKDKVQNYILLYLFWGVLLQGISLAAYEMGGFNYPDISALIRGYMALIYSVMAVKFHFISYDALARDTLLSDIGAGFIVLTNKYRILYANDIAKEVFPELETLNGKTPYSEKVKQAVDYKETEMEVKGATYRITADRLYDRHKLAGYSLIMVNISDFVLLEKQAMVSREAKEKLLTNMAHELRTPINAIAGESEMMIESTDVSRYPEYARNIHASVERLSDSINYLIDAFNEETKVISPTDNPYNICVLLDTVIANCKNRANKKEIDFEADIDPKLYTDAIGDDSAVYKLLMNNITNAIRYTESGKVSLFVTNAIKENGDCEYKFIVTDTGEKAANYLSIEDSNEKTNMSPADLDYGFGISFLLAKRLIESLNGEFKMWSGGQNSNVFLIKIPQKISSQNTIAGLDMQNKMKVILLGNTKEYWNDLIGSMKKIGMEYEYYPSNRLEIKKSSKVSVVFTERPKDYNKSRFNPETYGDYYTVYVTDSLKEMDEKSDNVLVGKPLSLLSLRRVFCAMDMIGDISQLEVATDFIVPSVKALVVDDEYLNRKVATQILENFKIKVDSVPSGYDCLELLKEGREYDIIFMDYMMEGLNGIDTTRQIRELDLETKDTCIIAFTANDAPGAKEKYFAAGMNDVLFKPVSRDDFARILRKYIPEDFILEKVSSKEKPNEEIVIDIPGIDVNHGLIYTSNNLEAYKSILIEFAKETYDKSAKISEFYSLGDWYDFVIYVHGVKSSSRMLGMDELGEMMAGLEAAGKTEDKEYIDANITKALDLYESFVPKILMLDKKEDDSIKHSSLYRLVSKIKSAAEEFEMDDVETLVGELASGNYGELEPDDLKTINEAIEADDYYELVGCIEMLLIKIAQIEKNMKLMSDLEANKW